MKTNRTHLYNAAGRNGNVEPDESEIYSVFRTGVNVRPDNEYGKVTWKQFLGENTQ